MTQRRIAEAQKLAREWKPKFEQIPVLVEPSAAETSFTVTPGAVLSHRRATCCVTACPNDPNTGF
jgi:hypothetical protein